jgi:hypothetical protein
MRFALVAMFLLVALHPAAVAEDLAQAGEYESGRWSYSVRISNPGTRSEGRHGALSFDGLPLPPPPAAGLGYQTPWGVVAWVAARPVPWGEHGWMPQAGGEPQLLPDPAPFVNTTVRICPVLLQAPGEGEVVPDWISWSMADAGEIQVSCGNWVELGGEPVVLQDPAGAGQVSIALGPIGQDDEAVPVLVNGAKLVLSRRNGSHGLRHCEVGNGAVVSVAAEVVVRLTLPEGSVGDPAQMDPIGSLLREPGEVFEVVEVVEEKPTLVPGPVPGIEIEPVLAFDYRRDALVFTILSGGYSNEGSFTVRIEPLPGLRRAAVTLVRVRRDEGKMVPQPTTVSYPLSQLGIEPTLSLTLLNPIIAGDE